MPFEGPVTMVRRPREGKKHLSEAYSPLSNEEMRESAQLLETLPFDLSFWDFIQPSLRLPPAIEFHNLIQFALSVVILSMKQTVGRGENEGGGERRRRKEARKESVCQARHTVMEGRKLEKFFRLAIFNPSQQAQRCLSPQIVSDNCERQKSQLQLY